MPEVKSPRKFKAEQFTYSMLQSHRTNYVFIADINVVHKEQRACKNA